MSCMIEKKKNNNKTPSIYKNLFDDANGVVELVFKDFITDGKKISLKNKLFSKKNKGFILFYAPWCGHCKNFKKEYDNIALDYIQLLPFGSVNIENVKDGNDKLRSIADIDGIPTLMFINREGHLEEFKSDITYDNILYWINMNA